MSASMKCGLVAMLLAVACSGGGGRSWEVEYQQVLIDHQEIEGFMPAMTMNFDVTDAALLDGIEKGQAVAFRLHYDGKRYSTSTSAGWAPATPTSRWTGRIKKRAIEVR